MKRLKISLLMAMLAVATIVSAQSSFGIKGGLNMSNMSGNDLKDTEAKLGFHVGVFGDYEFMPNMAIQSGLFFHTKGASVKDADGGLDLMYLQLPVHFAYKIDVTPDTRVVLHAGPYAAYGVSGNMRLGDKKIDVFKDRSIDVGGVKVGTDGANRFDAGLGLGAGAEFGQFLVDIGWDMGLVKFYKNSDAKTQNAYLSVGYRF